MTLLCVGQTVAILAWATGMVALLLAAITLADFSPRERWPEIEAWNERLMRTTQTLARELPSDARLATVRGFHYGMLMDRPVYSLRWADRRGPGLVGIDAVIDRYRINTLLLDPTEYLDLQIEPQLVERYGEGERIAGVRVIRVRN